MSYFTNITKTVTIYNKSLSCRIINWIKSRYIANYFHKKIAVKEETNCH